MRQVTATASALTGTNQTRSREFEKGSRGLCSRTNSQGRIHSSIMVMFGGIQNTIERLVMLPNPPPSSEQKGLPESQQQLNLSAAILVNLDLYLIRNASRLFRKLGVKFSGTIQTEMPPCFLSAKGTAQTGSEHGAV